jgi:tetratricopeptide (TPR) repeat protein
LDINCQGIIQYKQTVWQVVSVTLDKLSESAKRILYTSAYLNPISIDLEIFRNMSVEAMSEAIKVLREHSLITIGDYRKSFRMHRLIQQIILLINADNKYFNTTIKLANDAARNFNKKYKKTWNAPKLWLMHITSISKHLSDNLDKAELLDNYARIAKHFGMYHLAHDNYLHSLEIQKKYYDNEDIKLVKAINRLGVIKWYLGEYSVARDLYAKVLAIKEKYYTDPYHIELANSLSDLASVEWKLDNYMIAKKLYERSLKIKKNYYKNDMHIELADTIRGIGDIEYVLGRNVNAMNFFEKEFTIRQNYYGILDHIVLAKPLSNLAAIKIELKEYKSAINLLKKALLIIEGHYQNAFHIELLSTIIRLIFAHELIGDYIMADKYFERLNTIVSKNDKKLVIEAFVYGYSPMAVWPDITLENINTAIAYYEKSLKLFQRMLGFRHYLVARYHYLLGQAYETGIRNSGNADLQYKVALEIANDTIKSSKNGIFARGLLKNVALVQKRMKNKNL